MYRPGDTVKSNMSKGPKFGAGVRGRDIKSSSFVQNDYYCLQHTLIIIVG